MYLRSYGGVLSSHDQVNMADWTLESWLAVKGAASPKVENLRHLTTQAKWRVVRVRQSSLFDWKTCEVSQW